MTAAQCRNQSRLVDGMVSYAYYHLHGLFQITGSWKIEKHLTEAQMLQLKEEHEGKHSLAIVRISGEDAEWHYAWFPTNLWHFEAIRVKVQADFPNIKGELDVVRRLGNVKDLRTRLPERSASWHLVVFQHGICGTTHDLSKVATRLNEHFPELRCVVSNVNVHSTLDGIRKGGRRLAALIKSEAPQAGGCLSCVGHSLGGIYCRQAFQMLEEEDWFSTSMVQPVNFVTLASPHLGITEMEAVVRAGIWVAGRLLDQTVQDLALNSDAIPDLADETALRALGRFRRRAAYANLGCDLVVRACSGLILPCLPDLGDIPPRTPHEVVDLPDICSATLQSAPLHSFPEARHATVRQMLLNLCMLSWERYVVRFTGNAHVKICNHGSEDTENDGVNVLEHVCTSFLNPSQRPEFD